MSLSLNGSVMMMSVLVSLFRKFDLDGKSNKGLLLICQHSEDIFPNAVDYYQGPEEDDDNDEDIELGSEEDSDGKFPFYNNSIECLTDLIIIEDEEPKPKKSKK